MNVLAVIPARSGSKRVPNKNFADFYQGKSLVDIARHKATRTSVFHCVVATDGWRLPEHRGDLPMDAVVATAFDTFSAAEAVIVVQPTSPLVRRERIEEVRFALVRHSHVRTVVEGKKQKPWNYTVGGWLASRAHHPGFIEGGGIYGVTREGFEEQGLNAPDGACIVVDPEEGLEIDTPLEWEMVRDLYAKCMAEPGGRR